MELEIIITDLKGKKVDTLPTTQHSLRKDIALAQIKYPPEKHHVRVKVF